MKVWESRMLPKFHAGTLITDLEKGAMFWLVLRILPNVKVVWIFHIIHPATIYFIPTSALQMPVQKLMYHDYVQPVPKFFSVNLNFSVCNKTFLEIHLTYTNALDIVSDKKKTYQK